MSEPKIRTFVVEIHERVASDSAPIARKFLVRALSHAKAAALVEPITTARSAKNDDLVTAIREGWPLIENEGDVKKLGQTTLEFGGVVAAGTPL